MSKELARKHLIASVASRRRSRLLALAAAGCLVVAGCGSDPGGGEEETYDLSWSTYLSPENPISQAMQRWIEEVDTATEGRVSVEPFYLESLCATTDGFACVQDGRADIASSSVGFHPAEFPLANAVTIPFISTDPQAQLRAYDELYESDTEFAAEFETQGVHVLYFTPTSAAVLGTSEPANTYDWLSGKSVRGTARMVDALQVAGANPVALPITEVYESSERGLIDAWFAIPFEAAGLDYQLQEVSSHFTDTGSGIYINGSAMINLDLWESLPQDIQQAMTEAGEEVADIYFEEFETPTQEAACDAVLEAGVELSVWPDEEKARWADAVGDQLREQWQSEAEQAGAADPAGFFERYQEVLATYEDGSTYVSPVQACAERAE